MKKKYTQPHLSVVCMNTESGILAASDDIFSVGTSDEEAGGSEALSNKKNMWGKQGIWD